MESANGSSEPTPSDLELAVTGIKQNSGLVGYRNLLSYASALGVKIFPKTSFNVESWTQLGYGSYSTTWRAEIITGAAEVVAVKQPNASFTRASVDVENTVQHEALTSIIQELRLLASAKLRGHRNLPAVLGVFFQEEENPVGIRPCVVFELATYDLKQYLLAETVDGISISPQDMARFASDVADGIGALHTCGLVHGDVKPENILLFKRDGVLTAAVGDLGTCGACTQTSGVIIGSLHYCAPEYHRGSPFAEHINSLSRDIYNYGLLLWSILTFCRENPFAPTQRFMIQHDDQAAVQSLLERAPDRPALQTFRNIIRQCVRSDPTTRPTIFEVSQTLDPTSNTRFALTYCVEFADAE
ncbi:kinase-like domain-containing protein [Macrophomina phaseolina]|uniref:Kinase-like domain-containing protein n=1 Tax=Macrophomina phaseolina TaxID=35725 RepID=A0ABQ8GR95_9PEZI|nr:kinase-like domain-containing protein [Macrophomina phaseolina]